MARVVASLRTLSKDFKCLAPCLDIRNSSVNDGCPYGSGKAAWKLLKKRDISNCI